MSDERSARQVVFEGWEMRQWSPTERPKQIDPKTWDRVERLRTAPLLPYTATAEYLGRIRERISPYESPPNFVVSDRPWSVARQAQAMNSTLKYQNAKYKYIDTHLMMDGTVKPKDAFVQEMAKNYAALRMMYPSGAGELAANVFGEIWAHGVGYQVDLFKASFSKLRPPIYAFSSHDRRYEATANYVARVASEIGGVATPLRAVAFRHAMETGDRSHYWDRDLANAYYAADRAREQADSRNSSPAGANREHSRVVVRIQQALESGRPFDVSHAHESLAPVQSR